VSGGQQQRAALARALLLEPKWLLLDEPNSALDVEQNELLIKILKRLKMKGTGIIFSNHLLGFAAAIADEVYFLDDGHVVEKGGTSILALPSTARMSRFLGMFEHRSSRSENGA
jgi:ABC-type polar amino acid transport system ATPase subunit